jgi:hypothetical protein
MVQATETFLIELRATGNAEKALQSLGQTATGAAQTIARAGDRSALSFVTFARVATTELVSIARTAAIAATAVTTVGAAASIAYGRGFVKAALDAEGATSKFNVVFGEFADEQEERARALASTYQRSFREIQLALGDFGNAFVPLGFARDEAAELSLVATQLAIDIASLNDATDAEAYEALRAALQGSAEALRRYGAVIKPQALEAELLARGIAGGVDAATEQEKVLARLSVILRQTADAQGETLRSGDEFEEMLKAGEAAVDDLTAKLGRELVLALQSAVGDLGGLDQVLELIEVGLYAVTRGAETVIVGFGEAARVAAAWIEEAGGIEVVMVRIAGAAEVAQFALRGFGLFGRTVFLQLEIAAEALSGYLEAFFRLLESGARERVATFARAMALSAAGVGVFVAGLESLVDILAGEVPRVFEQYRELQVDALRAAGAAAELLGRDELAENVRRAVGLIEETRRALGASPPSNFSDGLREQIRGFEDELLGFADRAEEAADAAARSAAATRDGVGAAILPRTLELARLREELVSGFGFDALAGAFSAFGDTDAILEGLERQRAAAREGGEAIGQAVGEGVAAGLEVARSPLEVLADVTERVLARAAAAQQEAAAQSALFAAEYQELWGRVTPTVDEQIAAIEQWAATERSRLELLAAENRLTAEQADRLLLLVDRVEREEEAKARSTATTGEFGRALAGVGDRAVGGFADALAEAALSADLAAINVRDLAQAILADLIRAAIQAAVIGGLTGGSLNGLFGVFGFAGGGVASGPVEPVGQGLSALANGPALAAAQGLPFHAYAGGGVVSSPQLFVAGEGQHEEAIVPMPNGAVPVEFKGGGRGTPIVLQMNVTVQALDGADATRVFERNAGGLVRTIAARLTTDASFRRAIGRV